MSNYVMKLFLMYLMLILTITGCSFASEGEDETEKSYNQPVLELSSDYTVGSFLYKDEEQYYIHENKIVEYKPELSTFTAMTEVDGVEKEFIFQWYEWNDEIKVLNEAEIDTFFLKQ